MSNLIVTSKFDALPEALLAKSRPEAGRKEALTPGQNQLHILPTFTAGAPPEKWI